MHSDGQARLFSVQPLGLCGELWHEIIKRDTENSEVAQRNQTTYSPNQLPALKLRSGALDLILCSLFANP
jgi:hypothetical protein